MGSFNATCIVSNLPIEAGDPVRFLALARSKYHPDGNDHVCYVSGRWHIHGVPLKAKYNDYGVVEDLEDSFTTRTFFHTLSLGAVEKGVGDNSCHDVAVRLDMDEDGWIEALWEGRVEIDDNRTQSSSRKVREMMKRINPDGPSEPGERGYEPPVGMPSLRRIEEILKGEGLPLSSGGFEEGFLIDEVAQGFVRIRNGGLSSNAKDLNPLLLHLHAAGYAAMITMGTGSYAHGKGEILVAALPPTDPDVHLHSQGLAPDQYEKPRPVSLAMIREDVWQILLNTPIESWTGSSIITFESFLSDAMKALEEDWAHTQRHRGIRKAVVNDADAAREPLLEELDRSDAFDYGTKNLFTGSLSGHEGVSGLGFREAYNIGLDRAESKEEAVGFVTNLAETIYVQWGYSVLHGQWHPTTNSDQEGRWKEHRAFLLKLAEIKGRYEDEDFNEDSEDEAGEEESEDGEYDQGGEA